MNSFAIQNEKIGCVHISWYLWIISYLEIYRQHIVIIFLFTAVNLLLFFERFWRKFIHIDKIIILLFFSQFFRKH